MSQEKRKRSRASSADDKPKPSASKRQKPPTNDDDIVISLGGGIGEDLVLNKRELARTCDYFAEFANNQWPERFVLRPNSEPTLCRVISESTRDDSKTKEATDKRDTTSDDEIALYAKRLNRVLFAYLYRENVEDGTNDDAEFAKLQRDTAVLAKCYGCVRFVKSEILVAIRSWGEGNACLIQQQPCMTLEAATILEDEPLFLDALRHAAGQRAAGMIDLTTMPEKLATVVDTQAEAIKDTVEEACKELQMLSEGVLDLPKFLAWAIFHRHLVHEKFSAPRASKDRFLALRHLFSTRVGSSYLDTAQARATLSAADNIWTGLDEAKAGIMAYRTDHEDGDILKERYTDVQTELEGALAEKLQSSQIRLAFQGIIANSKPIVAPLFAGDKNVEYFTFLEFEEDVPWEKAASAPQIDLTEHE